MPPSDTLTEFLREETLRPILRELARRVRLDDPADVLRVALSILAVANEEKVAAGARLLLEYPDGRCTELRVVQEPTSPRLVAKNGQLVDTAAD